MISSLLCADKTCGAKVEIHERRRKTTVHSKSKMESCTVWLRDYLYHLTDSLFMHVNLSCQAKADKVGYEKEMEIYKPPTKRKAELEIERI